LVFVKQITIDEYDSYIVVSFVNATLVLSIGETVTERTDTGFLDSTPTITVGQLGEDALVQVGICSLRQNRFMVLSCLFIFRFTPKVFVTFVQIVESVNGKLLEAKPLLELLAINVR
jgi:hypothetical protein